MPEPTYATALVTGASGFIGAALCRRLLAHGVRVTGVARRPEAFHLAGVHWRHGDLTDPDFVSELFRQERPERVFHLAGFVSGDRRREAVWPALEGNLLAHVRLLLAALEAGCPRVLATGSLEEPEPGAQAPFASPYAAAKWAAAGFSRLLRDLYGAPVVTAKVFMVYGPAQRDRQKLVPFVLDQLLAGQSPALSSGTREVDWIFVEDVVDAYLAFAEAPGIEGETLDVGSGQLVSLRAVVEQIQRLLPGSPAVGWGLRPDRPFERIRRADPASATARTGWRPVTSLAEGLARTLEWHRAHPLA
jgi:nucleoside-diphosphate-sugar epimerase